MHTPCHNKPLENVDAYFCKRIAQHVNKMITLDANCKIEFKPFHTWSSNVNANTEVVKSLLNDNSNWAFNAILMRMACLPYLYNAKINTHYYKAIMTTIKYIQDRNTVSFVFYDDHCCQETIVLYLHYHFDSCNHPRISFRYFYYWFPVTTPYINAIHASFERELERSLLRIKGY